MTAAVLAWALAIGVAIDAGTSLAAQAGEIALAGVAIITLIGAGVTALMEGAALGVQGRVVEDAFGDRWVQLRGVHPAFVRALLSRLR